MAYECPVCLNTDENAYMRCTHPSCPDGRDPRPLKFAQPVSEHMLFREDLSEYWMKYYFDSNCTLCGNIGIIDTRGVKTPAGVSVGRLNYCICLNGQALRIQKAPMEAWLHNR